MIQTQASVLVKTDASVLTKVAAKALVPNPRAPREEEAVAIILHCHHHRDEYRFRP
jgi:hypothetical protein